ncbi:MAG: ABC transporter substrate-binding protein, partial [Chloroflexota bacterium]|nr:ABC transporter substrate-binding protein [Chloroflexota bacterium]
MRSEENYWTRNLSSRLSRRRFVGGATLVTAGAASLALVGCGDDEEGPAGTTPAGQAPTASPTAAPSPTQVQKQKGGIARFSSANNTWDTFDADRSRFTPFATLLGYTNLGIVHYRSFERAELEGALAESWEQPDPTQITFKLRPNVYWHNKPPVNGRQVTVEDLKFFIERNKAGKLLDGKDDPNFYRKTEYATVDKVEVVDSQTLRVTFTKPNPFFLTTLAGSYAKVQAPEAVREFESRYNVYSADLIIGTGAYILTEFNPEGSAKLVKNDKFYDEIYIEGVQYFPLFTDIAAQQASFEQKQIDAFSPRTVAVLNELLQKYKDQIYVMRSFSANPMGGTYYGGAPPWSDKRLIGAIFKVIDRRQMVQLLFQGSGAMSGNIPPAQAAFGIPERELVTFEGYREDRAKEIAEAKQMWDAAQG